MRWPLPAFRPRLVDALAGYTRQDLAQDAAAGLTVGAVALPLAMAFGIASGVKPEQGLATAIVAGFLVALLGGSRVQIAGPAGAFVVLLYAIVERHGVDGLLLATMAAGVLLFLMGALRLGNLVRYMPVSIITGFTNGIAVVIALQQVKDFLGLRVERMPANFLSQLPVLREALPTLHAPTLALGLGSLAVVVLWPKGYREQAGRWRHVMAKLPGTVVVLVGATLVASLAGLPVETVGSRFGALPAGLPTFSLPAFDWARAQSLVVPALSIALLGAVESLLCARVADQLSGDRHDPNQELMAQGVANVVVPFFGGFAATGTIARTVTNVRSGARTPVAGIVHALVLLTVVMVAAPLAGRIPLATLAAILLFVAWNMADWRAFARLRQQTRGYRLVMLTTFVLTVVFDLTVAIEAGLLLSALVFIVRISALTGLEPVRLPRDLAEPLPGRRVAAHRLHGSLFFGSVSKMEALLDAREPLPDVLVLELDRLLAIDGTGLDALESVLDMLEKRGGRLLLAEAQGQPLERLRRSGFIERIGEDAVFEHLDEAIAAACAWVRRQSEPERGRQQPAVG